MPQEFPDELLNLILEYGYTLAELITSAHALPAIEPARDTEIAAQEQFRVENGVRILLERYLSQLEEKSQAAAVAETHNVRLIRETGDPAYMVFSRIIRELEREREELLKNKNVSENNKTLLKTYDPRTTIEALIKLDEVVDNINMELTSNRLPDNNDAESIVFYRLGLTRLSERLIERLKQYPNLKTLNLTSNKLLILPDSIGNLTTLTELKLSYNKLTTLPDSIGNFAALTGLSLHNNNLLTLPESIGNLTALTGISLEDNQLTTLPESIDRLIALKEIYLKGTIFLRFLNLP